jgi:death on curing protein
LPASPIRFPTLDEVLLLHTRLIERFGGAAGVRDLGLLESALYRPQTGYYADVVGMAAALLESLWRNHPFIDGNKRVAVFTARLFLAINGWRLSCPDRRTYADLMRMHEAAELDLDHLQRWMRKHLVRG